MKRGIFNSFWIRLLLTTVVMFAVVATVAAVTQINLATQVQGILAGGNGGTGNGFFAISGPATSLKTFTFPNSSATMLTSAAAVTVAQGGTGLATLTAHGVVLGEGTSNTAFAGPPAADSALVGTNATTDPGFVALPTTGTNGCSGTSDKLLYNTTTHVFSCGADQTSSTNFADAETPTGTVDGSNAVFTLAHTPIGSSLKLFKNGQLMTGGGVDYTLATATVTYVAGAKPLTGDAHISFYRF